MVVYEFEGRVPSIAPNAYAHEDPKDLAETKAEEQRVTGAGAIISGAGLFGQR